MKKFVLQPDQEKEEQRERIKTLFRPQRPNKSRHELVTSATERLAPSCPPDVRRTAQVLHYVRKEHTEHAGVEG